MSQEIFVSDVIFQRKSIRSYTDEPVSKQELKHLMKAAMAAPTAKNMQPWSFIGLTDRKLMDQLAEGLPYAKMLFYAPAAIVVCGDLSKVFPSSSTELWIQDCAAATENILLAATSVGLGAVWTALYPYPDRYSLVQNLLHVPPGNVPFSLVPVGHPRDSEPPKNKYKQENIHWNKW
ncbi:MAG: nitroreductase family protein [Syntrophothermus sp.]